MGNLEVLILLACAISGNLSNTACVKGIAPKPITKQECTAKAKEWEAQTTTKPDKDGYTVRFLAQCVPAGTRA